MEKWDCPICGKGFKNPTVKSSKAVMVGSTWICGPRQKINPLKYDVVLCPHCGYSALERYFKTVTQVQKQLIQEKICANYKEREEKETFSYEDGFLRYKMAMMNCMVKQAYDKAKRHMSA